MVRVSDLAVRHCRCGLKPLDFKIGACVINALPAPCAEIAHAKGHAPTLKTRGFSFGGQIVLIASAMSRDGAAIKKTIQRGIVALA